MSNDRYDIYDDYEDSRNGRKRTSSNGKKRKKHKKKRSLKAKFFMVLAFVLLVYCVSALAYFGYQYYLEDSTDVESDSDRDSAGLLDSLIKPTLKERTVFAIVGVDEDGTRTDTIMVCCYNQTLDELTIISVPRDTLIEVSDEAFDLMQEEFPEPGQKGMKINAIYHYGAEKYGIPLLKEELEEMIGGVEIDYYCKVSFDAFEYLIDAIGGIEFDVPMNMDYDDPTQDLSIHLKAGLQTLNGEQAEGLVRYRTGYANADIGRVSTQQAFVTALLQQLVNKDTFFKNASAYLKTFFKYVETDVKLSDAVKYMTIVKDFNTDNIYTYTMPGYDGALYGITGGWVIDEEEAGELCYDVFQKPVSEIQAERAAAAAENAESGEAEEAAPTYDDKTLTIQVLNGGYTNGMASEVQSELLSQGYNVTSIGTHTGEKTNNTRIYVSTEGMGQQIQRLFSGSELIVDSSVADDHDIVVIIGIEEE